MNVFVQGVSYAHRGGPWAVQEAHLDVREGEVLGLIGPNGAGKSTLLACVLGFLRPKRGEIRIGSMVPDSLLVRARTGILGERQCFPPAMSALAVLEMHHALLRRDRHGRRREATLLLERVGLAEAARRRPSTFSHGMRQRLGLACAVMGDPLLLVLDEPGTGLDPPGQLVLRDEIRAARARGATVILSSHQLDEVERACERIAFMRGGVVAPPRPIAELQAGPRVLRVRVLTADGNPASASRLSEIVAPHGRLAGAADGVVRAELDSDRAAAGLVAALVAAGLLVVEAVAEETRLDALFRGDVA